MLRIYRDALSVVRDAGAIAVAVGAHAADLARQLRRAAASVPLNIAEGSGVTGRNARVRYGTALGSAREVRSCIDVAVALGYVAEPDHETHDRLDKVIAVLFKLTR